MFNYTGRKKEYSWKSERNLQQFDGVWGSPRAAGPRVSARARRDARDQWWLNTFLTRLWAHRSCPAGGSGDLTEMESYVASVVSDVLKKRREMDDLEAKAQERKLVRTNQQLPVRRGCRTEAS